MDPFTWALLWWIAIAGFLFFAINKIQLFLPPENMPMPPSMQSGSPVRRLSHAHVQCDPVPTPRSPSKSSAEPPAAADWPNDFVRWLQTHYGRAPTAMALWLRALNEAAKKMAVPTSCEIVFEEVVPEETGRIELKNVSCEAGPRDHMTLSCQLRMAAISLRLVASQRMADRLLVSNYVAQVTNLCGKVPIPDPVKCPVKCQMVWDCPKVMCRMASIGRAELVSMVCFDGRPKMDVQLRHTDETAVGSLYSADRKMGGAVDGALVVDVIRKCITSAVGNVNLNNMIGPPYQTAGTSDSPMHSMRSTVSVQHQQQQEVEVHTPPLHQPVKIVTDARQLVQSPAVELPAHERVDHSPARHSVHSVDARKLCDRLTVKVARGVNLAMATALRNPYVCLEIDDPSGDRRRTHSAVLPFWDEQFDFVLTGRSEELLFEVYDQLHAPTAVGVDDAVEQSTQPAADESRFLGLAIVSLDEVWTKGGCHQGTPVLLELPLESRPYYEDPASGTLTVQFTFINSLNVPVAGSSYAPRQLLPVERRPLDLTSDTAESNLNQVKSVSQYFQEPSKAAANHANSDATEIQQPAKPERKATAAPIPEPVKSRSSSKTNSPGTRPPRPLSTMVPASTSDGQVAATMADENPARSASSTRRRPSGSGSFFRELRNRLTGGAMGPRSRARSVDAAEWRDGDKRGRKGNRTVSGPPSRDQSLGRTASSQAGNRSLASAYSSKSLYHHSTLLVEVIKNGVKKHYLIPSAMIDDKDSKKLMRQGRKLHVFNEHTFVAVRVKGGTNCNICGWPIGRGLGRQAYQCRDCQLVCHKHCHFTTDTFCPQSTVSTLEIQYMSSGPST